MSSHGAPQAAKAPQEAAQATPKAAAAAQETASASGKTPFMATLDKVRSVGSQTAQRVIQTSKEIGGKVRSLLRFDKTEPSEVGLVKTPVYALGHIADGTVLNAARRGYEVMEPLVSGIRAAYGATIGAILSPLKTLSHPIEYLKKPFRTISSSAVSALNILRAPVRAIDDVADRAIDDTVKQVNFKLSKLPIIGPLIAKPSNFLTRITSSISRAVRSAVEWITSPVDYVHGALAESAA